MPKIPQLNRRTVVQDDRAVLVDPRAESIAGRSLQALGQGIQNFGQGIAQYQERRDVLDKKLQKEQFDNSLERSRQESEDFALRNAKPDGSDVIDLFEQNYNEGIAELEKSIDFKDDQSKQIFSTIAGDRRNISTLNLFQKSRSMHANNAAQVSQVIQVGLSDQAFNNPDGWDAHLEKLNGHFVGMEEILGSQTEAAKVEATKDMATSAIQGLLQKRRYDDAVAEISTGRFSKMFSTKERETILGKVFNKRQRDLNVDLQQENLKESQDKRDRKKMLDNNSQETLKKVFLANQEDDIEMKESINDEIDALVATGQLDRIEGEYSKKLMQDDTGKIDDRLSFDFTLNIADAEDSEDLDEINKSVQRAVIEDRLSAKVGQALIRSIKTKEKQFGQSPEQKQSYKNAEGVLKAEFGPGGISDIVPKPRRIAGANAKIYMDKLIGQGVAPVEAARRAIRRFGDAQSAIPTVPFVGVAGRMITDTETSGEVAQLLKNKERAGQITKSQYYNALSILGQHQDIIDRNEQIKSLELEEKKSSPIEE